MSGIMTGEKISSKLTSYSYRKHFASSLALNMGLAKSNIR